jgi:hypothetical protein
VHFDYLAWRLWKSVVTLAVTKKTIWDQVSRRQRVSVLQTHRLSLTGRPWVIRWLIGRETKAIFCVFPEISMAVVETCFDACGDGDYYFRWGFSASEAADNSQSSNAVDRKSMEHTVAKHS